MKLTFNLSANSKILKIKITILTSISHNSDEINRNSDNLKEEREINT